VAFIPMTVDNLNLFLNKLRAYDRYYSYSDDPDALERGRRQEDTIKEYCENVVFQAIYDLWLDQTSTQHMPLDEDDFYKKVLEISSKAMNEPEVLERVEARTMDLEEPEVMTVTSYTAGTAVPPLPSLSHVQQASLSARFYLDDEFAATHYILSRTKDMAKLYTMIKWRECDTMGVVHAAIYECRITKGFNGHGNQNNTITSHSGVLHYVSENCLLAYLLSAYW